MIGSLSLHPCPDKPFNSNACTGWASGVGRWRGAEMNRNSARLLIQNPHVLKRLAKYMAQQCFRNTVLEDFLLELDLLKEGTSVIIIGNPGVGKTFLAQILGWRACQANIRVLFTTAMDMLNHLLATQVDHSLVRKLKVYTEPTALLVDELGYLALDQQTSNLFYQVISTRHAHKRSSIITTNTAFSEWGNILYNSTIAAAIADRLVENSEIFLLGGESLRKAQKSPPPAS